MESTPYRACISRFTKRQPIVVSSTRLEREKADSAFGITNGARLMLSAPPAIIRLASPALIARAAVPIGSASRRRSVVLWIDSVNAKGGVHGQKIELVSLDDGFSPARAAQNAKKLIEEQNGANREQVGQLAHEALHAKVHEDFAHTERICTRLAKPDSVCTRKHLFERELMLVHDQHFDCDAVESKSDEVIQEPGENCRK